MQAAIGDSYNGKRTQNEILRVQLENERSSFIPSFRDLGDYIMPRRPRFYTSDTNKGERRNLKIVDTTATLSARTLRAGMMTGITSPARPWFKLGAPDPRIAGAFAIKSFLAQTEEIMRTTFIRSNLYNVLPILWGDGGIFGTGCILMEPHPIDVVRFKSLPIGSYAIGSSDGYRIDIITREFRMTVRQVVGEFAPKDQNGRPVLSGLSQHIQSMWQSNQREAWVEVCHVIKPNPDFDPRKGLAKYKRYVSTYYEKGSLSLSSQGAGAVGLGDESILRESGYDYFPALVFRWETTGEDSWGTECPGMVAIGDIKELQALVRKGSKGLEKMVDPAMVGPTRLKNGNASILPGDMTYLDEASGVQSFRAAHEVNINLRDVEFRAEQIRSRIKRAFFEDLFLMIASSDRRQVTAREIEEAHQEKLLAVGPVLEQANTDVLDPLIDNTFYELYIQDRLPPIPEELSGTNLKVEYISIMAQAQKLAGIGNIERYLGLTSQIMAVYPEVRHVTNPIKTVEILAELTGVPVEMVRSQEEREEMQQAEAAAASQQQQMMQMQQEAQVAKDLSQTSTDGNNALSQVLEQL